MPLYRRLPKRGFRTRRRKDLIAHINLSRIQEIVKKQNFASNDKINLINLQKLKFISKKFKKLKLLGSGELKDKLNIEVNSVSKSAKEKIEKNGGKVTLIK